MKLADEVEFMQALSEFAATKRYVGDIMMPKSEWFECDLIHVYMRVLEVNLYQTRYTALVISNVTIQEPYQGKGLYAEFLQICERLTIENQLQVLYVEDVLFQKQYGIYLRRGFQHVALSPELHRFSCFYKAVTPALQQAIQESVFN